jgi:hypothetical protein
MQFGSQAWTEIDGMMDRYYAYKHDRGGKASQLHVFSSASDNNVVVVDIEIWRAQSKDLVHP